MSSCFSHEKLTLSRTLERCEMKDCHGGRYMLLPAEDHDSKESIY